MSIASPIYAKGDIVYIVRLVTSLDLVNARINSIVLLSVVIAIAVLIVVLIISIGLANSIVKPINDYERLLPRWRRTI